MARIESLYDDDLYHADDIIVMSDHGLWAPRITGPTYYFNYTFRDFMGNRQDANCIACGQIYTLPSSPLIWNYGIAHTGPADTEGVLVPVRVDTDVNYEEPHIGVRTETRPDPSPLQLTVTASGLQQGIEYTMYRYCNELDVPAEDFHSENNVAKASKIFKFQGDVTGTFVIHENIMSNEKVIYRALRS